MVKIASGNQRLLGELIPPAKRTFILLLCDLEDKFRATAEAGYDGVSLILNNIERYLGQKHSSEEMVSLLDKYQIPVSEFGYTFEWHY
jgi:sugar phosphate isomerase/epimerase